MADVNALLTQRLNKKENSSKMAAMAERSANGNLTSFSGVFNVAELSSLEQENLRQLLSDYSIDKANELDKDLNSLIFITSEVKAINNQAALLHGERIKKAQTLFKKYRDGAFTAWLMTTYGNRQTPYNLLQYYEFYIALPKLLQTKIEEMPRQAIYTLASREGPLEQKIQLIKNSFGQSKTELLQSIRELFPLRAMDKRAANPGDQAINALTKLCAFITKNRKKLTKIQKQTLLNLTEKLQKIL
ncbi:Virulence plasmid protein pGP6-D-related protein [Chlamydiales bacterium STE3]|nr:Virulence plasmid protein pGP6-D-related protein [Chlamydiales bacterium STE3]